MANTRRCPFYNCKKMIDPKIFACREHWPGLEDGDRMVIWQLYSDYLGGKLHITELVMRQAEIMLKNTPQTVPGAAKGVTSGEVALAKKFETFLAKRTEYSKCNIGFADKKKRIGMELGRLEAELHRLCKAILHPEQTQLSLFDNPADEAKPQMPD